MTRRQALGTIGSLAGLSVLTGPGCAVNPVTGRREIMLMTEQQEVQMGGEAHADIVASYGSYADSSLQAWFDERGKEMSWISHRSSLPYHFTILDSPIVNAFAVPGGYIYITRGILAYFNNEAQFAGVLGHELGHVNARHTAARYSKAQLANLGLAIGTIFSEDFRPYANLASVGTTLLFLKFSRDDEREADSLGVQYSSSLGYDAGQMSEFFFMLERLQPKGGSLPAWQSTHPDPGDRILATKKMALAYQQAHSRTTFVIRKNEYFERVNGIVFGEDPRQGYVQNRAFYHPEMKFRFPVPVGWNVTNKPSEVRMAPSKQDSLIIFTAVPGNSPAEAASRFVSENRIAVSEKKSITINGMPCLQTVGGLTDGDTKFIVISYFIQKDSSVFSFHGLSGSAEVERYAPVYRSTASGFNRLTNASQLNVAPKKIEIREIQGSMTLLEALKKFDVPEGQRYQIALLNGMELKDSLPRGTRLKVVL